MAVSRAGSYLLYMKTALFVMLTGAALLLFPAIASAQPAGSGRPPEDRNSLVLGLGGGIAPEYEGADDYGFQPGGVIQGKVDGFDFQVRGPNIYVDLLRDAPESPWNLIAGPVAQVRFERNSRNDIDDPRVAALGTRDTAVELGGYVGIGRKGFLIPP
ncbi:MAG: hypothetical protein RIS00_1985, partial [Pseudomonadota bacterium]